MYINHVRVFADKMEQAFKAYADDECLEFSRPRYDKFRVSKKDSAYLWCALDGAIMLWNTDHKESEKLCFGDDECTADYDEYVIEYWVDVHGCNA